MIVPSSFISLILLSQSFAYIGFPHRFMTDTYRMTSPSRGTKLASVPSESMIESRVIRQLGGFERLLGRKVSSGSGVSLSHASAALVKGLVDHERLMQAVAYSMRRHPMLRVYIEQDSDSPKRSYFKYCTESVDALSETVVESMHVPETAFSDTWSQIFEDSLNGPMFSSDKPQWKLINIYSSVSSKHPFGQSAWVFVMNHAIDDQQSVNILIQDLLDSINSREKPEFEFPFPVSMEEAVGPGLPGVKTIQWGLFQLKNLVSFPVQFPPELKALKNEPSYCDPNQRRTIVETFSLDSSQLKRLVQKSKERGLTVTNTLSAAMLLCTSAIVKGGKSVNNLRFLLSVGLRPYGEVDNMNEVLSLGDGGISKNDFSFGTVACAGGAVDFIVPVDSDLSVERGFWQIAEECKKKASDVLAAGFVEESVRLFGFGMEVADILRVVEMDANDPNTLGRGFSCGVSNTGRCQIDAREGEISVSDIYFGTSHHRNGVLCQLSCMSVGDSFFGCLQYPEPIVSRSQGELFRVSLERTLSEISES
jgi:hypothetical protein